MKRAIHRSLRAIGYDVKRVRGPLSDVPDATSADQEILKRISSYTMTPAGRQLALIQAVRYLVRRSISGCFVECGVWRGGSSMAMALALEQEGLEDRDIYLFDTFEGMTAPTEMDKTVDGIPAQRYIDGRNHAVYMDEAGGWCAAGLDDVQINLYSTGYAKERIHFVKGPVEKTIPAEFPVQPIALLRLDTDWYESTRHEMIHLFPLLSEAGMLILDDYGKWQGARTAVDEYLSNLSTTFYLHRIDESARLLIKQ